MEKKNRLNPEQLKYVALLLILSMALIYFAGHEDSGCTSRTSFVGDFAACNSDGGAHVESRDGDLDVVLPGVLNGRVEVKNRGEVLVVSNRDNGQCGTFFIVDDEVLFQSDDIENPGKVIGVRVMTGADGKKELVVEYIDFYYGAMAIMRDYSANPTPQVVQFLSGYPGGNNVPDPECA